MSPTTKAWVSLGQSILELVCMILGAVFVYTGEYDKAAYFVGLAVYVCLTNADRVAKIVQNIVLTERQSASVVNDLKSTLKDRE